MTSSNVIEIARWANRAAASSIDLSVAAATDEVRSLGDYAVVRRQGGAATGRVVGSSAASFRLSLSERHDVELGEEVAVGIGFPRRTVSGKVVWKSANEVGIHLSGEGTPPAGGPASGAATVRTLARA